MSNIIDYLDDGFDDKEQMETEDPPPGDQTVDIQTSESELEDHGDYIEEDSSVLDSSNDPPLRHKVPTVGPVGGYTADKALPPSSHTSASVSSMHVNVSTVTPAGVCTIPDKSAMPVLWCSAHPTSWQPGCAVCDQALLLSSIAPIIDPKMAVTDQLLGRTSTKPTHAVQLGLVGLEVARHVCHQPEPMTAKEASNLMATHLKLPPAQEQELNSNLQAESLLPRFLRSKGPSNSSLSTSVNS